MGVIKVAGKVGKAAAGTVAGRAVKREVSDYAIDNILVLVIVGSAFILRFRDRRRPEGQQPALLRLINLVPDGLAPLPLEIAKALAGGQKK